MNVAIKLYEIIIGYCLIMVSEKVDILKNGKTWYLPGLSLKQIKIMYKPCIGDNKSHPE